MDFRFSARVRTGSPGFSLKRDGDGDGFIIYVRSPPQDNKANMEIVKELKGVFKREVRILAGLKSREKVILIKGLDEEEFLKVF